MKINKSIILVLVAIVLYLALVMNGMTEKELVGSQEEHEFIGNIDNYTELYEAYDIYGDKFVNGEITDEEMVEYFEHITQRLNY